MDALSLMKPVLLFVVVGIVCAAGGYLAGRYQGTQARVEAPGRTVRLIGDAPGTRAGVPGAGGPAGAGAGGRSASRGESVLREVIALTGGGMNNQGAMMKAFGLMGQLEEASILQGLRKVEELTNPQQQMMLRMGLLMRMAEFDGRGAIDYVEESVAGQMRDQALMTVATTWAGNEPDAALEWFQARKEAGKLDGPMGENIMMTGIFGGFASKDLAGAFAKLASVTDQDAREQALQGMASSAFYDPGKREQFLGLIAGLDDPQEGENAIKRAVGQWAQFDAKSASAWLEEQDFLNPGAVDESRKDIASRLAWSLPQEAAKLVGTIESDNLRGDATRDVVRSWAQRDTNAAAAWLGEQGDGPELDGARGALADAALEKDPESAFVWASTITAENQRERTIQRVFNHWHEKEPGRAAEFLVASDVERDKVEQWLKEATEEVVVPPEAQK